jgi:LysR family transcriptional activator of nhaA
MKNLNHQHLFYFWHTVREGSMQAAARVLGVTQPTVSAQIGELERALGRPLFLRHGKSLETSEFGLWVARYAEDIFTISNELLNLAQGRFDTGPTRVAVGVVDVLPKSICFFALKPLAQAANEGKFVLSVSEGALDDLVDGIANRSLDFVLADAPIPPQSRHRVFSRKLCSLQVWVAAESGMAKELKKDFPKSLSGKPFLFPKNDTQLRHGLDLWFHDQGIEPRAVGVFDDTALMKQFARAGMGALPIAAHPDVEVGLDVVGPLEGLTQSLFLISPERKQSHPALAIIQKHAQNAFGSNG